MHYLGMYGMRFGGYFEWSLALVGLSLVIAVVAASAALWLAFHTHRRMYRVTASFVMGAAVCAMHYTGMAAATVVCTTADRRSMLPGLIRPSELGVIVTVVAVGVAAMVALDVVVQNFLAAQRRENEQGAPGT